MMSLFGRLILCLVLALGGIGVSIGAAQPIDPLPDPPDPDEVVSDTAKAEWTYDATARLNVSQAAYKDWQEGGGTNSLAITAATDGIAEKRGENWLQSHELRFAFGLLNQEGQELRKAEDRIRYQSSLRYQGNGFFRVFNPTVATQLRTQFVSGFSYDENPYDPPDPRANEDPPVQTSTFFAPAFITESLGLTYEPVKQFTLRLGAASKQTVVVEEDFRELYGVSPDQVARVEAGGEFAASLDTHFTENIRYRSDLNVFLALNQMEEFPDMFWENTVALEVNDWLSTDLQFTALYDESTSDALQLKETISVGLSFTLL